jgi:uncharacterized membrane protein HdeD (DUF308 family)
METDMTEVDNYFEKTVGRYWWILALRGLVAIIFGILAFVLPKMTLLTLVFLFGIYALVNGILALVHAFSAPKGYPRFGAMIFSGVISIAAGVIAFIWPGITALSLVLLIAAWAIIGGISEIATAIRLRHFIRHEWLMVLAGAVSVVLGVAILLRPAAGALALLWWIGGFAIAFGILLVALAFRVRHLHSGAPLRTATP